MNKWAVVVAMAVMTILAVIIAAVAFVALIGDGGNGDVPPSLIDTLKTEEGFSSKPYLDTRGFLTVGYGSRIEEELSPRRFSASATMARFAASPWTKATVCFGCTWQNLKVASNDRGRHLSRLASG